MRKYISLRALIGVLSSASVLHGQVSAPIQDARSTPTVSKQLIVNGRPVKTKLLQIDGKHFVAVEDLAQSLGGSVGYSDEQLTLTFAQPSPSSVASSEKGRIKGTLTYFFNSNYGNRPDTGSTVWLVEGHIDIPDTEVFIGLSDRFMVGKVEHTVVKHSVADGNGNFDLSDVPAGQYTLALQSNHTKGLAKRDLLGKVRVRTLQIKAGETFDASTDFGMTAY